MDKSTKRIKVLFPFVEAGFGHIMPMKSVAETFEKKYGDKFEIILSDFFTETGDKNMMRYEQNLARHVKIYNRFPVYGFISSVISDIIGPAFCSFCTMKFIGPIAYKKSVNFMKKLAPDVVFSTHWATNYYAEHLKNKPLTVMYCPDAQFDNLFSYKSDLHLISMPKGYEKALNKKRFGENNLKLVDFLIRNEAFSTNTDKRAARRKLGLPENNFTVLLVEGAYGIGKMEKICKLLLKKHIPLNVIAVCGKNEKLFKRLSSLTSTKEVHFKPYGFVSDMFALHSAADIFCGKSGNMLSEATFFGVPIVVTKCANLIEYRIADHYINTVGSAIKEFSPKKTVKMIKEFSINPDLMIPYKNAALSYHNHFGSEEAADELYKAILAAYLELI